MKNISYITNEEVETYENGVWKTSQRNQKFQKNRKIAIFSVTN